MIFLVPGYCLLFLHLYRNGRGSGQSSKTWLIIRMLRPSAPCIFTLPPPPPQLCLCTCTDWFCPRTQHCMHGLQSRPKNQRPFTRRLLYGSFRYHTVTARARTCLSLSPSRETSTWISLKAGITRGRFSFLVERSRLRAREPARCHARGHTNTLLYASLGEIFR